MMLEVLNFVYLIFVCCLTLALMFFDSKKEKEYKNDERWKSIKKQTSRIVYFYYTALTVVVMLSYVAVRSFFDVQTAFTLSQILQCAFYILMLRYPIEFITLYHYDKVI